MLEVLKEKYGFKPGAGYVETNLEAVRFFWSTECVERAPLIYNAGLVFILQGSKVGWLGDYAFHYNVDHYLVLGTPLPFDCATYASPESPLLGLFVDFNRIDLLEIAQLIGEDQSSAEETLLGAAPVEVSPEMREAVNRLLKALESDVTSRVLGAGILREIAFHTLCGPHGVALRALCQTESYFSRIAQTVAKIRKEYKQSLPVEALAREAAMSEPVFHRAFKSITGLSPHQYLKTTRLHRAKEFIIVGGRSVGEAARMVGYDDPAHFSREFKKHFKVSPKEAQLSGYLPIDI